MIYEEFRKGWELLCSAFPSHAVLGETAQTWWRLLEPMPNKLYVRGILNVLETHRFHTFPTPAQVIDILENDRTYEVTAARDGRTAAVKLECYRVDLKQGQIPGRPIPKELPAPMDPVKARRNFGLVLDMLAKRISMEDALKCIENPDYEAVAVTDLVLPTSPSEEERRGELQRQAAYLKEKGDP